MTTKLITRAVTLENLEQLIKLCGPDNLNLAQLEDAFSTSINYRGQKFQVKGEAHNVELAVSALRDLYDKSQDKDCITEEDVHMSIKEMTCDEFAEGSKIREANYQIKTPNLLLKPRSQNQLAYCQSIDEHSLNFGIGPAGTGKTFLAVAQAVKSLLCEEVRRIVLVRPVVEAGENLGFLPGDLTAKIDPYLRPLYDALYEMIGFDEVNKYIERHLIEVVPLAYMRGRTLNDSFIILDEAQNTTEEQMKMFLTRIGFGSKSVITGDITQTDLPRHKTSGLAQAQFLLENVSGISFSYFSPEDVVRHPLVKKIIEAYEKKIMKRKR